MFNLLVSGNVELEKNMKEKLLLKKKAEVTPSISHREGEGESQDEETLQVLVVPQLTFFPGYCLIVQQVNGTK